ncbi:MAG: amino acid ABC transporter permease [Clostridia bacterium]|nr:amino acid ABC transporter permease [Clostridia bacterium]
MTKTKILSGTGTKNKKDSVDLLVLLAVVIVLGALGFVVWKGNNFTKKWEILSRSLFELGGVNHGLRGLKNTVIIAVLGLVIGVFIGTLIAVAKVIPSYSRAVRYLQKFCDFYVALFRGTPMVVQLLLGYFILLPMLGITLPKENACTLIFGLNSGAYVSEIMRGGINSVDPGQTEAGRALGLSFSTTMLKIVVPQAVKNILPTLGNEFITLIKETSIVGYVGAMDLCVAFQNLGTDSYEYMMPYLVMAFIYIILVLVITLLIRLMERRLARSDRKRS